MSYLMPLVTSGTAGQFTQRGANRKTCRRSLQSREWESEWLEPFSNKNDHYTDNDNWYLLSTYYILGTGLSTSSSYPSEQRSNISYFELSSQSEP